MKASSFKIGLLLAGVLVSGCATTAPMNAVQPLPPVIEAPVIVASPTPAPSARKASAKTSMAKLLSPLQALEAANVAARQRPAADGFNAARQVYAYKPGALFELYTNPNYVSTILLEPGETLNNIAAGDTSRWMVTQADAETQNEPRTIVLVKPHATGLRTNIVLITDRRTYLIEAIAQSGSAYAAQVAWSYPLSSSDGVNVTKPKALNESYRIRAVKGGKPVWTPSRVFDDGRRTWIEFPPDAEAADLPPVFVITGEGAELVNYRVQSVSGGTRYMIDRVFDRAELRLGAKAPVIVRIERSKRRAPV